MPQGLNVMVLKISNVRRKKSVKSGNKDVGKQRLFLMLGVKNKCDLYRYAFSIT
jgi:hypothetical protein